MQAIRVYEHGGPEVMKLEDITLADPKQGEVLIRIRAAGVNPVDTYIRAGTNNYSADMPYTPGKEAAGIIEAVGAGVVSLKVGMRVFCSSTMTGAYATHALCQVEKVYPLPDHISFAQGACLGVPYATACRALFARAEAKKGDLIFVHGASGGVGTAAMQLAKGAGMTVIASAGRVDFEKKLCDQGADFVVNHNDPGHFSKVMEYTEGRGVDVILEMLANVNLGSDLPLLKKQGRVVIIGNRGDVEINPRDLMVRDAAILGMALANADDKEQRELYEKITSGLQDGSLNPVVGEAFDLTDAPLAHSAVISSHYGHIVFKNRG